jgi:hypothetical protein
VNQSVTGYNLSELRKEVAASKATSMEVELETSSSRFVMRNLHPSAAVALREFASQVVDAWDGGAVWLSDPAASTA